QFRRNSMKKIIQSFMWNLTPKQFQLWKHILMHLKCINITYQSTYKDRINYYTNGRDNCIMVFQNRARLLRNYGSRHLDFGYSDNEWHRKPGYTIKGRIK